MTVITEDQLTKAQPRQDAPGWGDEGWERFEEITGRLLVIAAVLVVLLIGVGAI